uniref:mucin-7-like isoform X8 n=1 Tax=Doryrhamphus excisus TaxID=161450 RepID=UPI0025ADBCBD|nr:mucin-7-like isoform X8 [Doryrhamphus excisus]
MEQQNESDQPQKLYDTRSVASKTKTSRSSRSSTSSAATKARASAEAALVEAKYAAREAEMMKVKAKIEAEAAQRKAELEASLYVLKIERSATAAAAEAAVYEGAAAVEGSSLEDLAQIPPEDTAQHTSEYVKAHYVTPDAQQPAPVPQQPLTTSTPAPRASLPAPPSSVQWYPLPGTVTNQPTTIVNGTTKAHGDNPLVSITNITPPTGETPSTRLPKDRGKVKKTARQSGERQQTSWSPRLQGADQRWQWTLLSSTQNFTSRVQRMRTVKEQKSPRPQHPTPHNPPGPHNQQRTTQSTAKTPASWPPTDRGEVSICPSRGLLV